MISLDRKFEIMTATVTLTTPQLEEIAEYYRNIASDNRPHETHE
jgi:hypothetical protein